MTGKPRPFTTLELAEKTYAKGFSLSGGEEHWTAYHLAEQVLNQAKEIADLKATLRSEGYPDAA